MRLHLGLLCLICIMETAWAQTEFKIITLQHRFAQDLVSALQPLAGPGGVISATGNHLLVEVAPERMAAIEQAVAQLDVASKTFRIRVDRTRSSQESAESLSARGRLGSGDVRIQRTRPGQSRDGVTIEMDRRSSVSTTRGSEYVSVQDGARAFIAVGQSVPVTEYWMAAIRNHAQVQSTVRFREMTTGFTVLPRQIGREVELEIAPRISSLRDDDTIDFLELATTVRVVPGEWVNIGATMQARDEVSRAILAGEQRQGESNAQIWVLVE
jgi:type II secretory pathway component GspD/PulD (secretin)